MKRILFSLVLCTSCVFSYSQDSMNKKIENPPDKMVIKMENKSDHMNKKIDNTGDTLSAGSKRPPGRADRKRLPKERKGKQHG